MRKYLVIKILIALVWLINGLFCKVLSLVPRHEQIVANILSTTNARAITIMIGLAETAMAGWILSGAWRRVNAIVQIIIIVSMNVLEYILVPDLLLWGKANAFFACLFILLIWYNEFRLDRKTW